MVPLTPAQIDAYLLRIKLRSPLLPTLESLRSIQWAHVQTAPFENLDIRPLRRPLQIETNALYEKIVERRRGGFCFELNGLLALLLEGLGYGVTRHSMVFIDEHGGRGTPFDHLVLHVTVPDNPDLWRVDVGIGREVSAYPLPLRDGYVEFQPETGNAYRLRRTAEGWWLELKPDLDETTGWRVVSLLDPAPRQMTDFAGRCLFFQTDPDCVFTQGPICSWNIHGGRVSLTRDRLITTMGADRHEEMLPDMAAWTSALQRVFGIDLGSLPMEMEQR